VSEKPQLLRAMGLRDVTLFIVTAGSTLQWSAIAAASGPSALIVWFIGAVAMFLPLALSVVFLASRYPDEGGLYVWSKLAFGPFGGFMSGWTYWAANLPYFPALLYYVAGSALYWSGSRVQPNAAPVYFIAFSAAALAIAVVLNVRGLTLARWLNGAGAVARWLGTALLIVLGLAVWWRFGSATPLDRRSMVPAFHLSDLLFWSTVAFAWTGPEGIAFMGGEIRDPQRTVPRALAAAAPMIAGVYLLGTAGVLVSIPSSHTSGLYGVMDAISADALRLGLPWLVPLGVLCVLTDRLGSLSVWLGAAARIPFVAGLDHYLPRSFARLHPRYGSPVVALWTQGAIAAAFALLGQAGTSVHGAYNVLVEMMVVATLLPFVPLFGAAIKLSGRPPVTGEVRIPGGRLTVIAVAALGLLTTLVSIGLSFVPSPEERNPALGVLKVAGMTAVVLLLGAVLYVLGRARARREGQ
jgi:glutamate:GABA antiporter